MKMHKDQLTERQRLFCEFYVGSGKHNAALAARLAGYAAGSSHVTGCQLLRKGKIAEVVRALEAATAVEMAYTRERLIAELLEAVNMGRSLSLPSVMVSGLVAIGKAAGLYAHAMTKPKTSAAQNDVARNMAAMTDQQLLALISSGPAVA